MKRKQKLMLFSRIVQFNFLSHFGCAMYTICRRRRRRRRHHVLFAVSIENDDTVYIH